MNDEVLKTLSLCSFFVFLFGALGFLVTVILNTIRAYVEASSNQMYEFWVKTQMFVFQNIIYYLLVGVVFAGLGFFLIYRLKQPTT